MLTLEEVTADAKSQTTVVRILKNLLVKNHPLLSKLVTRIDTGGTVETLTLSVELATFGHLLGGSLELPRKPVGTRLSRDDQRGAVHQISEFLKELEATYAAQAQVKS